MTKSIKQKTNFKAPPHAADPKIKMIGRRGNAFFWEGLELNPQARLCDTGKIGELTRFVFVTLVVLVRIVFVTLTVVGEAGIVFVTLAK